MSCQPVAITWVGNGARCECTPSVTANCQITSRTIGRIAPRSSEEFMARAISGTPRFGPAGKAALKQAQGAVEEVTHQPGQHHEDQHLRRHQKLAVPFDGETQPGW